MPPKWRGFRSLTSPAVEAFAVLQRQTLPSQPSHVPPRRLPLSSEDLAWAELLRAGAGSTGKPSLSGMGPLGLGVSPSSSGLDGASNAQFAHPRALAAPGTPLPTANPPCRGSCPCSSTASTRASNQKSSSACCSVQLTLNSVCLGGNSRGRSRSSRGVLNKISSSSSISSSSIIVQQFAHSSGLTRHASARAIPGATFQSRSTLSASIAPTALARHTANPPPSRPIQPQRLWHEWTQQQLQFQAPVQTQGNHSVLGQRQRQGQGQNCAHATPVPSTPLRKPSCGIAATCSTSSIEGPAQGLIRHPKPILGSRPTGSGKPGGGAFSVSSTPLRGPLRVIAAKSSSSSSQGTPQGLTLYPKPSLGSRLMGSGKPGSMAEGAEAAESSCMVGAPGGIGTADAVGTAGVCTGGVRTADAGTAGREGWRSAGGAGEPSNGAAQGPERAEHASVNQWQSHSSSASPFSSVRGTQGAPDHGQQPEKGENAKGAAAGNQSQEQAAGGGKMLLVDGSALLYRAFYKVEARVARHIMGGYQEPFAEDEDEIGTVFAFLDIVVSLLLIWRPTHLAIVLDHPGPTFRRAMYSGYKKNRSPMPDSLRSAIPLVEVSLRACGLRMFKVPGVEADDVIATLAEESLSTGMRVRVASPDKDFFQLLGPRLSLLRPEHGHARYVRRAAGGAPTYPFTGLMQGQLLHFATFGEEDFRQKFGGLEPEQFVDLQALMGDKCDAVPGARGIGEKTAPKLMRKFGSLDNLLASLEEVQEKRYREALQRSHESVLLSRELVQLKRDVAHGVPLEDLVLRPPHDDGQLFWELVQGLELDSVRMGSLRLRIRELWRSLREQEEQRMGGQQGQP